MADFDYKPLFLIPLIAEARQVVRRPRTDRMADLPPPAENKGNPSLLLCSTRLSDLRAPFPLLPTLIHIPLLPFLVRTGISLANLTSIVELLVVALGWWVG